MTKQSLPLRTLAPARASLPLLAALNGSTFIAGYFQSYVIFWASLFMAFIVCLFRFYMMKNSRIFAAFSVLFASILYLRGSFAGMTWDVASFELPKYYDLIAGSKGPYWTYAPLPSVFAGSALSLNLPGAAIVYSYTLVLFALSLCELLSLLPTRGIPVAAAILSAGLLSIFNSVFHVGKGDLLAASFSNIMSSAIIGITILDRPHLKSNSISLKYITPATSLLIACMFAVLAFLSKTGSILLSAPLLVMGLVGVAIHRKDLNLKLLSPKKPIKKFNLASITLILLVLSLVIYLREFLLHGLPSSVEFSIASMGKQNSLFFGINHFMSNFSSPMAALNGKQALKLYSSLLMLISFTALPLSLTCAKMFNPSISISSKVFRSLAALAISLAILFMPFAALHPLGNGALLSTENLRLIAQPAILLLALSFA